MDDIRDIARLGMYLTAATMVGILVAPQTTEKVLDKVCHMTDFNKKELHKPRVEFN